MAGSVGYLPYLKGAIGSVVGGVLLLCILHLWQDHRALHVLIDLVNQQAAQQTPQRSSTPPPPQEK
jgi:hypothetical protein